MKDRKRVAVIVAHPDDETLWAGGTLLDHPEWDPFILCLCRRYDPDRAPKFKKTLERLKAKGVMADVDDGPLQTPQNQEYLSDLVLKLLPQDSYDLILTHSPLGEYTRHLRHEEIGISVMNLWLNSKLECEELLVFAYGDENRMFFPRALKEANLYFKISSRIWQLKYNIITEIYGFKQDSWEAQCTPKAEAFWRFKEKTDAIDWLKINVKS